MERKIAFNNTSFLVILGLLLSFGVETVAQNALTSKGAKITVTSGSALHVNGNSHFLTGSIFTNNGSFSTSGKLTTDQNMAAASLGTLIFNGSSTQTIDGSGTYLAKNVVVNNAAGLLLSSPLKVEGNILLTNGVLSTATSLSPLILTENATINGGSDNSHINGYIQKEGIGAFTYPVGNGSKFQPITLNLDANSNGFLVKYFSADAGAATFGTTGASNIPLQAYNTQEYWDLKPVGTAAGRITILWDAINNASITTSENINVFKVAHKTAAGWLNEGSSLVTGSMSSGSVISETISSWSPFTLGAISEGALPVTLLDFRARLVENQTMIEWSTTNEQNASYFEVQRSTNAKHFETIGKVSAAGISTSLLHYSFMDNSMTASGGVVYYRLRSIDADESFSFSRTISIKTPDPVFISTVYPNPVLKKEMIIVESNTYADHIAIYNMLGRKLTAPVRRLSGAKLEINTAGLADGFYIIRLDAADKTVYHKLIVQ